jgi:hypothetical protein
VCGALCVFFLTAVEIPFYSVDEFKLFVMNIEYEFI